ncbi:MAG: DUF1573 domain-containing protein [Planctomycetaceae bacterium]|jgi:hypothetical protein|nr:DUF1573 domain-containing protein [Planctomycetaceae bacterium]
MNNIIKTDGQKSIVPNLFLGLSGLLFFVAVCVFLRFAALDRSVRPSLTFTPAIVQFGTISQGTVVGKATVKNTSNKSIIVDSIVSSCDCTQVLIERGVLLPDADREISFQWDTRGRRGESGTLVSVVYFFEGETVKYVVPLNFSATVIPDFDVLPNELNFHSNKSESLSFSLKQTGHGDNEIQMEEIILNHPAFSIVTDETKTTGTISFDSGLWTDDVRYLLIQIKTSSKNEPIFRLPINIITSEKSR